MPASRELARKVGIFLHIGTLAIKLSPERLQIADRSCRSHLRARENSLAPGWPTIRDDRANGAAPPRDARLAMIRYALACDEGHAFESWFANSATYDRQVKRGLVSCPVCNSTKVEKAIMAPRVAGTKRRGDASVSAPMPEGPASSQPSASKAPPETPQTNVPAPVAMMSPQEREFRRKLKELREHLIRNADYVGRRFPEEARKMHYAEIEHRSVYGEATPDQAKELHEEAIEFHPLPVLPDEWN